MASLPTSSLSRYRPIVLATAGAAAALSAFFIYSSYTSPTSATLHRSNALRRRRPRGNRPAEGRPRYPDGWLEGVLNRLEDILHNPHSYGSSQFQNIQVELDIIHPPTLESVMSVEASEAAQESLVQQFHTELVNNFLQEEFSERPLNSREASAVARWLLERGILGSAILDALEENYGLDHRMIASNIDLGVMQGGQDFAYDGNETTAGTEISLDRFGGGRSEHDAQLLTRAVYYIAEDRHRQEGVIHRGITCDQCDTRPIRGVRWRCANCADFDLCSYCEADNRHDKTHVFYKIKVPAPFFGYPRIPQPPPYPGKPHMMPNVIPPTLKKHMLDATSITQEEMDGFWDQFTCLANARWPKDPNNVGWAIDRKAFNRAFIPHYSKLELTPNLVYDRVFALYDTDGNGLIGFKEFVNGLDGLHSRDARVRLKLAFNGYDFDDDGLISRKDCLRLFKAYYNIQREATRDYVSVQTEGLSIAGADEVIRSSQPLSSAFSESIPRGNRRRRLSKKNLNVFSDPANNKDIVRHDNDLYTIDRNRFLAIEARSVRSGQGSEQERLLERWRRRHFYLDEEDGYELPHQNGSTEFHDNGRLDEVLASPPGGPVETLQPNGVHHDDIQEETNRSGSSSKELHVDKLDADNHSAASVSPRVTTDRWGGYEIPQLEWDFGRDLLYQITQQGFNELLDPLFRDREDLAREISATKVERRKWRSLIEAQSDVEGSSRNKDYSSELFAMVTQMKINDFEKEYYAALTEHITFKDYKDMNPETIYVKFLHRLSDVDRHLRIHLSTYQKSSISPTSSKSPRLEDQRSRAIGQFWSDLSSKLFKRDDNKVTVDASVENETVVEINGVENPPTDVIPNGVTAFDPTMPQNRPNSDKDLEVKFEEMIPSSSNVTPKGEMPDGEASAALATAILNSVDEEMNVDLGRDQSGDSLDDLVQAVLGNGVRPQLIILSDEPRSVDDEVQILSVDIPGQDQIDPDSETDTSGSSDDDEDHENDDDGEENEDNASGHNHGHGPKPMRDAWLAYAEKIETANTILSQLRAAEANHVQPELPTYNRLRRLVMLQKTEQVIKSRGGPGRITYDEFEERVLGTAEFPPLEGLGFVESWLECVGF